MDTMQNCVKSGGSTNHEPQTTNYEPRTTNHNMGRKEDKGIDGDLDKNGDDKDILTLE